MPGTDATRLVGKADRLVVGRVIFVFFHTPGETPDHLTVGLPQYKVAFIGDNFYASFPNLYTLRDTRPRSALEYVSSLNRMLELGPELVLPSHGAPIKGADEIRRQLVRYRDAIQHVHDATVRGMNDGKDVFTLMREIKLPASLDLGESYGRVSWSVRGIYEGYVGWFDRNPASMYSYAPNHAYADLVALAGGSSAEARKARELAQADPIKALHLADAALAGDPQHREGMEARLAALRMLESNSNNGNERGWLAAGIRETQSRLSADNTLR